MKYLGCAYYPEYWGADRFETDAKLMQAAGINIARVGEFAWSRMEPKEGEYTLDWLHQCIETLARYGINVLMCTPTATPPEWLTSKHPETCLVRADGVRAVHGARRHYCTTNQTYRRFSATITDVLTKDLARHRNIVAWQLDNEFGPELSWCFCPDCQARFQAWLRERYGTVEELNRRWGTGFWSKDYTDWSQVTLSNDLSSYSSRTLDSKRFWSAMMIEFAEKQSDIIRRNTPHVMVTTNGMGPIYSHIDYYKLFAYLDVACDDLYFDIGTMDANVCAMNIFRSIKPGKRFWVTETGSGALDHNKPPHPLQFRAWAWSSLAHGAEAHMIFRWRTCLSGQEQELQGILEHSGQPRQRYKAVQNCFLELRKHWENLQDLPPPDAPVAIVQDYDTLWGYEASRIGSSVKYTGLVYDVHKALWRRNIVCDLIPTDRALNPYRLVILPSTMMISQEFAERLNLFVRNGGTVLAIGQIGMRDDSDNYLPYPGPDHLQELLGIRIEGGMYLKSHVEADEALWEPAPKSRDIEVGITGVLGAKKVHGSAGTWVADVSLNGASFLMRFTDGAYAEQPAVVSRQTGGGNAIYVASTRLDTALFGEVLDHALSQARIQHGIATPENVEAIRRANVVFLVNHTQSSASIPMDTPREVMVGAYRAGMADLGPYGVCVLRY